MYSKGQEFAPTLLNNLQHSLGNVPKHHVNYEGLVKCLWGAAKLGLKDHPTVSMLLDWLRAQPPRTIVVLEQLVDALVTLGV